MRFWLLYPWFHIMLKEPKIQTQNLWNPTSNICESSLVFPVLFLLQRKHRRLSLLICRVFGVNSRKVPSWDRKMVKGCSQLQKKKKHTKKPTNILKQKNLLLADQLEKRAHGLGVSVPTLHTIGSQLKILFLHRELTIKLEEQDRQRKLHLVT